MENRITKRTVLSEMLENEVIKANPVWVNYLSHEIELLDKKALNKKPSKVSQENEGLKDAIAAVLTAEGQTIAEIAAAAGLTGLTPQKMSPLLKALVKEGRAIRVEDKKALFAAAEDGEEVEGG